MPAEGSLDVKYQYAGWRYLYTTVSGTLTIGHDFLRVFLFHM